MTQHLPPSLLSLFAPRPPIPYMPPVDTGTLPQYTGLAQFLTQFEETPPSSQGRNPFETKSSRKKRLVKEKLDHHRQQIEEAAQKYDPTTDTKATGDPYRTLFVGKISYNTTEHKLKREFEIYGPVKKVRVVQDEGAKPRGYAFIEYEKERDMKSAYKQADGKKIDGRRVLVDIERGRTARGWRPRKFGGGLGYSRATSEERDQLIQAERERDSSRDKEREDQEDQGRDPREKHEHRDRERMDRGDRDRGDRRDRERDERPRERERGHERDSDRRDDRRGDDRRGDDRRGEKRPRERESHREERY